MKTHSNVARLWALALGAAWLLGACSRPESEPAPRKPEQLVVFAAASLREAFGSLAEEFEKSHAGVTLTFNFAGTQEIRTQLEQGAIADVFAAADTRHMSALRDAGMVEASTIFAQNEPVVVVAKEKGDSIPTFAELPSAQRIVIGAPEVPIGKYTLQILERASTAFGPDFRERVEARVSSRELNVRQVLAKVSLGEADAGIVYRSDLVAVRGQIGVLAIPPAINVVAEYPIAVVRSAPHKTLAREWIALTLSDRGAELLRVAGFRAPVLAQAVPR